MLKKLITLVLISILITNCSSKNNNSNSDTSINNNSEVKQFRTVNWNMTMDEVLKNETAPLLKDKSDSSRLLYFPIEMFGKKFRLEYDFDSSKLKVAGYTTYLNLTDDAEQLYDQIKSSVTKKYGEPFRDSITWTGFYRDLNPEKKDINTALSVGNVSLLTIWRDTSFNQKRVIILTCGQVSGDIGIALGNSDAQYFFKQKDNYDNQEQQNF